MAEIDIKLPEDQTIVLVAVPQREFTPADLTPYSLWLHVKTRTLYTLLSPSMVCSTNGEREHQEVSVRYWSHTHQHECYRQIDEFLDGRFVLMS